MLSMSFIVVPVVFSFITDGIGENLHVLINLFGMLLMLFLISKQIYFGNNLIRTLVLFFYLIGLVAFLRHMVINDLNATLENLYWFNFIFSSIGVGLLFTPKANHWFKECRK